MPEISGLVMSFPPAFPIFDCRVPWKGCRRNLKIRLAGPLAPSPRLQFGLPLGLGLAFALNGDIEGHGSTDQLLQRRLIDLLAFMDVDGAPDIPLEAGVE